MEVTDATWPETCLAGDDETPEHLRHPWALDGWRCYSDGRVLVALPDPGGAIEMPEFVDASRIQSVLSAEHSGHMHTYTAEAVREWAGPWPEACTACTPDQRAEGACAECDGEGWVTCECPECHSEHDARCGECGGAGGQDCGTCGLSGIVGDWNIRQGLVDGVRINRRLLARMLHGAPGEEVTVSRQASPVDPVVVFGVAWRGLIMPLREVVPGGAADEWRDAPSLEDLKP